MDVLPDGQVRRKACEECRRLKLKCDRKFPCHSCMRRGCAAICPFGTFMKGTRSLKTNSLKLNETITEMSARIVQLEEALAGLQSQISSEVHPLLEDDNVKVPIARKSSLEKSPTEEEINVIDSLSAFFISEEGKVIFHEATATSEYLLQIHESTKLLEQDSLSLPPCIVLTSVLFPFPPETIATQIDDFVPLLPPLPQAVSLVEIYFAHSAWCQNPLPREEFMTLVFRECYPNDVPATSLQHVSSHRLSLLFMIFALGALMDVNRPFCSTEAEEYHTLARACLCVEPVYESSSLHSVQSMHLMIWYYTLAPSRRTHGYRLAIWGVVIRLCQAIGLHHDTSKLNLDASSAKLRELVYWEVMCMDFWQAFTIGRPPSVSFNTTQCKRPFDLRAISSNNTPEAQPIAWFAWKHEYTFLLNSVTDQAFRSKGTTYSQILTLDQKLRNHPIPSLLQWSSTPDTLSEKLCHSPYLAMQRYMRLNMQESSLLHLHRRFFMQAIRANPENPLQHQFGHSVRAVFTSACATISGLISIYEAQPHLVCRFPIAWSHGFSAAVALSSLVISAPKCLLAVPALRELDRALFLFKDNENLSLQPPNSTAVLDDMQRKAYLAMDMQRPMPEAIPGKLNGVHPTNHISPSLPANDNVFSDTHRGPQSTLWIEQPDPGNWRQYATPAVTPVEAHAELLPEESIHVDIAPEETATEHSNWEMFIHQL